MNAKVADFGYHIPLPKQIGSTSIISTVDVSATVKCRGYLPSEFGEGIMGAETDVYAYGIVCCCMGINGIWYNGHNTAGLS